jgi:hypothetical protein
MKHRKSYLKKVDCHPAQQRKGGIETKEFTSTYTVDCSSYYAEISYMWQTEITFARKEEIKHLKKVKGKAVPVTGHRDP